MDGIAHDTRSPHDPLGDDTADAARGLHVVQHHLRFARGSSNPPSRQGQLRAAALAAAFDTDAPGNLRVLAAAAPNKHIPETVFWQAERNAVNALQSATTPEELSQEDVQALCHLFEVN